MDKKSFKYSFLLHLTPLLLFISFHGCGGGKGKGKEGGDRKIEESTKKQEPVEVIVQYGAAKHKHKTKPINKVHERECQYGFYGGLGIYTDPFDKGLIQGATKGYAGSDIGLEEGDKIVSPTFDEVKGEVGTELNLVVLKKNGETKTYLIVRDKFV